MTAAAVASLAALVVIAFNLPAVVGRFPATAEEPDAQDPTTEESESRHVYSTEEADLACPDLNELDTVPRPEGSEFETDLSVDSYDQYSWYRCSAELEDFSELVEGESLSDPAVRVTLDAYVFADANDAAVSAGHALDSAYFADWEHASFTSSVDIGHYGGPEPRPWMFYILTALDANLVLTVDIDYLYTDEDFDADAASQELAETVAESVVSQIPRS